MANQVAARHARSESLELPPKIRAKEKPGCFQPGFEEVR
jgi:hypothetical protein